MQLIPLLLFIKYLVSQFLNPNCYYQSSKVEYTSEPETNTFIRNRKKPDWVTDEIIRIKALMPHASCRLVSLIFNQRFGEKETVGKTFVDYTIRNNLYEIQILKRKIKSRPVYQIPFNKVWGVDLTFVQEKPVLGIVEHHSRKAMGLIPLKQKTSITILRLLLDILESTPAPKYIRTDNEICFNSKLIKFGFWILGIKHQTIDKHCPWQNGRVERFFGTLKSTLVNMPKQNDSDLPYLMHSFEFWYNNIRTHQNLGDKTPDSVYQKRIRELVQKKAKVWQKENPPDG